MEPDPHEIFYQQRRDHEDVSLNIVDVARSYEDVAPPFMNSRSSSFETGYEKCKIPGTYEDAPPLFPNYSRSSSFDTSGHERNSSYDNSHPLGDIENDQNAPSPTPKEELKKMEEQSSESGIFPSNPSLSSLQKHGTPEPIRYFPMLILANIFFIVGSGAFTWMAWLEEDKGGRHLADVAEEEESYTSTVTEEEPEPEGYRLHLSTSLDTWITKEMISVLVATFFLLQAGIVNLVRTWRLFHLCQILAGLCGLVSAMFWETKMLLSDIFYILFVHAMMLQAVLSLHMHYLSMIQPYLNHLKSQRQSRGSSVSVANTRCSQSQFFHPRRRRDVEGHFAFESSRDLSQNPSGLCALSNHENDDTSRGIGRRDDSDRNSFSIENSYSYDANCPPLAPPTKGPDEYDAPILHKTHNRGRAIVIVTQYKYGIGYCIADGIFALGAILEVALTYLIIFLVSDEADPSASSTTNESKVTTEADVSPSRWRKVATALRIVPGILWLTCAIMTLVTSIIFQRYATRRGSVVISPIQQ